MEKLLLITLLLSGLGGCKTNETEPIPTRSLTADEQPFVGTWRATKCVRRGFSTADDSTFYKADPPILTFKETGFYQYSEGAWNNRNGFIWVTGQELPALFNYTPAKLTITYIEYYNYQQRRLTAIYDVLWAGPSKQQFTLKLTGQSGYYAMTFVK